MTISVLCLLVGFAAEHGQSVQQCDEDAHAFTVAIVGHTGYGKSTLLDMLAGGVELAKVSSGGESETEDTVCYVMNYLGNHNPTIQRSKWRVLDTPGTSDSGGIDKDILNQKNMNKLLRSVKQVDAVFLVWKIDERFTPEIMKAISMMRLAFGPKIWNRLVIVYTFVEWAIVDNGIVAGCNTRDQLKHTHNTTITAIYNYVEDTLGVPEQWCQTVAGMDCFAPYSQIPFIGTGSTLSKVSFIQEHYTRSDYFDPTSDVWSYTDCETDANEFQKLWNFARELKKSPELKTESMVNLFVECETSLEDLNMAKNMLPPANTSDKDLRKFMRNTSRPVSICLSSDIKEYQEKIVKSLLSVRDLQVHLAFALRDADHSANVTFSNGFQSITEKELTLYPSAAIYLKCTQQMSEKTKRDCFNQLQHFYKSKPTSDLKEKRMRDDVLSVLSAKVVCSCDHRDQKSDNAWTCEGFEGLGGHCPDEYTCSSSAFASSSASNWDKVCSKAKVCDESVCDGDTHYFDPTKTHFACESSVACRSEECCLPSANCASYSCGGTNSNYGPLTLCHGPPSSCDYGTCCYCSAWNILDLFIGCAFHNSELEYRLPQLLPSDKQAVLMIALAILVSCMGAACLHIVSSRTENSNTEPLLSFQVSSD